MRYDLGWERKDNWMEGGGIYISGVQCLCFNSILDVKG